jgi:hypothetical protein
MRRPIVHLLEPKHLFGVSEGDEGVSAANEGNVKSKTIQLKGSQSCNQITELEFTTNLLSHHRHQQRCCLITRYYAKHCDPNKHFRNNCAYSIRTNISDNYNRQTWTNTETPASTRASAQPRKWRVLPGAKITTATI